MGRTYLARNIEDGTELAIKALYPSRLATLKDLELFQREADVLKRLDHPQIPSYVDAFHEGEEESMCYFLAQEYVKGRTLREVIDGGKRFDDDDFFKISEELFTVLEYLHSQSPPVVHRDVKPGNIIIREDGRLVLVDFGAVREVVRLTMGGGSTIIGTYGYMPPEQLMGRSFPATDVYAAGVTLLECLTRQTPTDLQGESLKRLIEGVKGSDNLRRLLSRLCAPNLVDRFQSAREALEDLNALKGGVLVHTDKLEREIARREDESRRALKKASVQRSHVGYALLVAFLMGICVLALFYLGQAVLIGMQTSTMIALALGATGIILNLGLMATRVAHDAWQAPQPDWSATKGRVVRVAVEQVLMESGELGTIHAIHYEYLVGGTYRASHRRISSSDYSAIKAAHDAKHNPGRWDRLCEFACEKFEESFSEDLRGDAEGMVRIRDAVKEVDRLLESELTQVLLVRSLGKVEKDLRIQLSRHDIQEIAPKVPVLEGLEFGVWFPPGRPEHHEIQDIRRPENWGPMDQFTHLVWHTPE